jgi:hypothetical protein
MRLRSLLITTSVTAALAVVLAPDARATDATLSVRMTPGAAGTTATAVVGGPADAPFALFAESDWTPGRRVPVTSGRLGPDGRLAYEFHVPHILLSESADVRMRALVVGPNGTRTVTGDAVLECSIIQYEDFSADFSMDAADVLAGEILDEQWAPIGMHVRAENAVVGPNIAIAFDSSNPTGGDFDLVTPGTGTGNFFAFGNVMIVAENDIDANGDGYIDDPDDDMDGGTLYFTWDDPVLLSAVTLVDVDVIDRSGALVRTYLGGTPVENHFVPGLDDNNVQRIALNDIARVDELQVEFSGSGAVAEVEFLPCPLHLTFDTTTTGMPFPHQAGTIVNAQWFGQGLDISGVTNDPNHPDEVVLFDTANPTGGDTDLVTPGYGPGNTEPRGMVIVLADNVEDLNGDGLVDDPGDSDGGGTFTFDFSVCATLQSATVLDIDATEPNCFFEAFDENGLSVGTWPLALLGDNSIQTIDFGGVERVRRLELTICASGALVDLVYCPTPEVGN